MQERRRSSQVVARHSQRSYSRHDTQECGAAGFDRDDVDDGSFGMGVRFQPSQCPAGRGRASGALLVIHLCGWLLYPDGVLFRVPSSAAGSRNFGEDGPDDYGNSKTT